MNHIQIHIASVTNISINVSFKMLYTNVDNSDILFIWGKDAHFIEV